jgi:hypothetical protein
MEYTISFTSDPGHGWGCVERRVLEGLGIADKISEFSYQQNDLVYLEEDCDLSLFIRAMEQRGYKVKLDERYVERTHIRGLPQYKYEELV